MTLGSYWCPYVPETGGRGVAGDTGLWALNLSWAGAMPLGVRLRARRSAKTTQSSRKRCLSQCLLFV